MPASTSSVLRSYKQLSNKQLTAKVAGTKPFGCMTGTSPVTAP